MTELPLVRRVAAIIGRAEFFAPLILTDPFSLFPPETIILSIYFFFAIITRSIPA
ncbi:MAG: hypothetical protein DDT31_01459 [Syntrophomonadaceae bacterium]|nr:hypothetical protein [Bacillota bacterium]